MTGENKWIATVEQRFFYDWYPLNTFQFVSAIFLDTGMVWKNGQDKELYSDVGVGFRLIPTRTAGSHVIHFDVAVPTNPVADIDNVQIHIKAKKSF